MMSTTRRFSLIGDSNVKRHLNSTNTRDRPLMSGAQLLPCSRLSLLSEALRSVRSETDVILMSCLTNFLTDAEEAGASVSFRVEPVFREAFEIISRAAVERSELFFILAPPMYRLAPLWYRDGLPEILNKFSEVFRNRPKNLLLMSSFATPEFEADGVHLTAYSGLEFMLHLFDASVSLIDSLSKPLSEATEAMVESSRVLEDRMMAIEQDHRRLNKNFEQKSAVDAEQADFLQNTRDEDWFVVRGLARQPEGLDPKDWQVRALRDVQGVLAELLGTERQIKLVVVVNKTSQRKDAETRYHVQCSKLEDSSEIRNKFGSFFIGGGGERRPDSLKHVSISNLMTPATSVRIAILKVLGKRYLSSNPGAIVKVITYEPRPLLKLTPPESASDRRVKTFNFIDAIKSLPTNFNSEEYSVIGKQVSEKLFGKLRSLFVVISDDVIKRRNFKSKSGEAKSGESNPKGGKGTNLKRPNSSPEAGNSGKQKK